MAEPSTRKVQITVPTADTSVTEWLDAQFSASESIRRLIRESVAREGFTDVANRPVRPPARPVYVAEVVPPEPDADSDADSEADARAEAAPEANTTPTLDVGPNPDAEPAADAEADHRSPVKSPRQSSTSASAAATIDDLLGL